jgi:hypothetical protein
MSRSARPVRPSRRPTPVLVVLILVLRIVVFGLMMGLSVALLHRGFELSAVVSSVAVLATAAAAAGTALTRNVLTAGR